MESEAREQSSDAAAKTHTEHHPSMFEEENA
jgi:hypothetical protein